MTIPLNKICELIVDCPHSTAPDEGAGYPLIRTPNIGQGYFDLEGVHRVSESMYNKRNARAIPQDNDLILAREAPAGNIAIIQNGDEFCLGQRTVLIRPDSTKVSPLWLNYYLNAPEQQHALLKNANGATVSHVNMPIIRNLPISLPDREEQCRVASVLAAYDKLIENNRKQIKLLEEAAQRLYKEWFIDLRFPNHETTPIDPVIGLPEGWDRGCLGQIVEFRRGKTITAAQSKPGTVPVVAGGLKPAYYHAFSNAKSPVVTISGSGANAGYTRLYTQDIWASDCSFVDSVMTDCLYFVYEAVLNTGRGFRHLQRGSAQPHVYPAHINNMKMLIPTKSVVQRYCRSVSHLFELIKRLSIMNEYLQEARNRLLPKLMSKETETV